MGNLLLILLLIFAGVGLMVVFGARFGGSPDTRRLQQ